MNTSNDSNAVSTPVCATPDTTKTPSMSEADPASIRNPQSAIHNGPTDSQPSAPSKACPDTFVGGLPSFPRSPGETPRAFNAFTTYFRLGHGRTLQAAADKLGEQLPTVKNWSSKYDWSERINRFNSGVLEQEAQAETEAARKTAADWAQRTQQFREQEWESAQQLLTVVQCCLENFGERDLEKIRLSELSRALNVACRMSRSALQNPTTDDDRPSLSPIQNELLAALDKICPPAPTSPPNVVPVAVTTSAHVQN